MAIHLMWYSSCVSVLIYCDIYDLWPRWFIISGLDLWYRNRLYRTIWLLIRATTKLSLDNTEVAKCWTQHYRAIKNSHSTVWAGNGNTLIRVRLIIRIVWPNSMIYTTLVSMIFYVTICYYMLSAYRMVEINVVVLFVEHISSCLILT